MSERQRFIRLASVPLVALAWMILFSASAFAQVDEFGKPDTCRVVVVQDQKTGKAVAHGQMRLGEILEHQSPAF